MERMVISMRRGVLFAATILVIGGCASQQNRPAEPPVPRPPSNQSETTPPQSTGGTSEGKPQAGQTGPQADPREGDTAEEQLQAAREKLRVSEETEQRIQAEFEALKQSGQATAGASEDYETYLDRVRGMVAENRELVRQLETAMTAAAPEQRIQGTGEDNPLDTARLDRELSRSLSEFDQLLLEEMDSIRAQSDRKMTSLAEEAAAAAERLRQQGIDVGTADEDADDETADNSAADPSGEQGEGDREGRDAETGAGASGSEQARTDTGGDAAGSASSDRRRAYSEKDDDIVARQLREAAEKETDPELKEKLWKEYEDYKRNTNR
jgi:hypothetical protein